MRRLNSWIIVLMAVLLVGGLSPKEALPQAQEVIKLKLATHWPIPHLMTSVMKSWIQDMETSTEGRLKITYYGGMQLLTLWDALGKISSGIVEMGNIAPTFYPGQFPLITVNDLPMAYSSATQGTKVLNELIGLDLFNSEFEAKNLKLLWGLTAPPYVPILAKKQIQTLEDWKGLRFRSIGGAQKMALETFGAIPVAVSGGDIFTTLQRGTIDGATIPVSAAGAFKLNEIANHVTNIGLVTAAIVLTMNLDTWNSLPKEIQSAVIKVSADAAQKAGSLYDQKEAKAFAAWKKAGINIYTPPRAEMVRWEKALSPIWDNWISKNEAKGLQAKKIVEQMKKLAKEYK